LAATQGLVAVPVKRILYELMHTGGEPANTVLLTGSHDTQRRGVDLLAVIGRKRGKDARAPPGDVPDRTDFIDGRDVPFGFWEPRTPIERVEQNAPSHKTRGR
jgi:hypothetical protein